MIDPHSGPGQLQLLTLLSKHAQIRGMVLELRHKSLHARQDSLERALEVQSRLMKWANEVHDIFEEDQTDDEFDGQTSPGADGLVPTRYRPLLSILEHESTIALNRPLLAKRPMTSASKAALEACIHASRVIIETVDEQKISDQRPAENIISTSGALAVWPLLTWSVWMSSFVLAYAALEGVTSISSAQR